MGGRRIEVIGHGGVRLSALTWGGGPDDQPGAVLLLHDLLGCAAQWEDTARRLAGTRRVLALDQRGHGRSGPPADGREDRAACVDDVLAVVDALGSPHVTLVGHGTGAVTAWQVAGARPEAVGGLVVCDARAAAWGGGAQRDWYDWCRSWPVPFGSREEARRWYATEDPTLRAASPGRGAALATALVAGEGGLVPALTGRRPAAVRESWTRDAHWDELARVCCPTLVVRGPEGELGRAEAQEMVRVLPRGAYAEIADTGHWLPWERPEAWTAAVRSFLDAAVTPAGGVCR
ncbi:alpha/beta fold hydrolase [Streptomyces sp. NPDC059740]|uniref:alpha/beta fold hydrolase n=1 Tax=Streptomyces sp. NPDC059740 TaxID=3346926 RepID=UPI003656D841